MTELKYEFAFNSNNEIIEIKEAVKGTPYFLNSLAAPCAPFIPKLAEIAIYNKL